MRESQANFYQDFDGGNSSKPKHEAHEDEEEEREGFSNGDEETPKSEESEQDPSGEGSESVSPGSHILSLYYMTDQAAGVQHACNASKSEHRPLPLRIQCSRGQMDRLDRHVFLWEVLIVGSF